MKRFIDKLKARLPMIKTLLECIRLTCKIANELADLIWGAGNYISNLKKY